MLFDVVDLVKSAGYLGITAVIFAESGLLLGFFLPGDSVLFTAGFLASQGFLDVRVLVILCFLAAILGDSVGYATGKHLGPRIFRREDSLFFHKSHLTRARDFYEKHGGKALIIARFMPIIRTFAPILAGVGAMRYSRFLAYNVIGATIWAIGVTLLGYWLGSAVPNADRYLLPIVGAIILTSFLPTIIHLIRDKESRDRTLSVTKDTAKKIGLFFSSRFR